MITAIAFLPIADITPAIIALDFPGNLPPELAPIMNCTHSLTRPGLSSSQSRKSLSNQPESTFAIPTHH
jgi:hypothetical protein